MNFRPDRPAQSFRYAPFSKRRRSFDGGVSPPSSPTIKQVTRSKPLRLVLLSLLFLFGLRMVWHSSPSSEVDWSQFAYSLYATDQDYLCNAVLVFDALERLGSKAERLLLYPKDWDTDVESSTDRISQLLVLARDTYNVQLEPVEILEHPNAQNDPSGLTWAPSLTKLLNFGEIQYQRILHIDSDVTLLQSLDDLFFLPPCPVAMPRAYWLQQTSPPISPALYNHTIPRIQGAMTLSSQLILITPSRDEFSRVLSYASTHPNLFDMDILSNLYWNNALILPHRPYNLISGEFRRDDTSHVNYLGSEDEKWDPEAVLKEAKLVHFSDWPLPKPWIWPNEKLKISKQPPCKAWDGSDGHDRCKQRELWKQLYEDFRKRRVNVCRLLPYPADRREGAASTSESSQDHVEPALHPNENS